MLWVRVLLSLLLHRVNLIAKLYPGYWWVLLLAASLPAPVFRSLVGSSVAAELLASRIDLRVEERTHIVACF